MTFHVPPADCLRDALAFVLMFGGTIGAIYLFCLWEYRVKPYIQRRRDDDNGD